MAEFIDKQQLLILLGAYQHKQIQIAETQEHGQLQAKTAAATLSIAQCAVKELPCTDIVFCCECNHSFRGFLVEYDDRPCLRCKNWASQGDYPPVREDGFCYMGERKKE